MMIDYVLINEERWEKIRKLEIGDKIDSDHYSLMLWLEVNERRIE